nr:hypothetical protein CFP56_22209 [Quercus suber]
MRACPVPSSTLGIKKPSYLLPSIAKWWSLDSGVANAQRGIARIEGDPRAFVQMELQIGLQHVIAKDVLFACPLKLWRCGSGQISEPLPVQHYHAYRLECELLTSRNARLPPLNCSHSGLKALLIGTSLLYYQPLGKLAPQIMPKEAPDGLNMVLPTTRNNVGKGLELDTGRRYIDRKDISHQYSRPMSKTSPHLF